MGCSGLCARILGNNGEHHEEWSIREVPVAHCAAEFSVEFRWNVIFNVHKLVRFLPVDYEEHRLGHRSAEVQKKRNFQHKSEMEPLGSFMAQTKVMEGHEEKKKVVQRRIRSILDGLYTCREEGFEVTTSGTLCWRMVPVVTSYCCDTTEAKDIYGARHETTEDSPCIWSLVTHEKLCSMNFGDTQSLQKR